MSNCLLPCSNFLPIKSESQMLINLLAPELWIFIKIIIRATCVSLINPMHPYIFALTGCFAPQAMHFNVVTLSSFFNWVSGFLHSGQSTNSFTYCSIFSLIDDEDIFLLKINLASWMIAGVASSRCRYFNKCSGSLLNIEQIALKFVIIVLFPSTWPATLGTSNLSVGAETSGTCL